MTRPAVDSEFSIHAYSLRFRLALLASSAALLGIGLWAFWLEPASLETETSSLALPGWSDECRDVRVAVLADLHVGSPFNGLSNLERIVAATQAASPDLILLAGDYVIHGVVGGDFQTPEAAAELLGRLDAPLGVFAVLGNHDWWLGAKRVEDALVEVGIGVLEDRAVELSRGNCRFWLAGLSDYWEGAHDVSAALHDVPEDAASLVFTHNPDVFPEVPERVALTIAGHTHGGQVYLPGLGRPVVPSEHGERYAIGHVVEEGKHLFVSPGIGTSILPVRFLVPPEITLLVLGTAAELEPVEPSHAPRASAEYRELRASAIPVLNPQSVRATKRPHRADG